MQPADKDDCKACDYSEPDTFDERIAKPQLVALLISLFMWWIVIAFIDSSFWKMCRSVPTSSASLDQQNVDEDIINEEKNVKGGSTAEMPIKIYGAKKDFINYDKCSR